MKKIILLILGISIVIGLIGIIVFIPHNIPPSPLPSAKPVAQSQQERGSQLTLPLHVLSGFRIGIFATRISSPRDLQFSPDGTLLVSSPNTGEVIALPDKNRDGVADDKKVIITGENRPHGLAFYQKYLYVADVDRVVRYIWDEKNLTATFDKTLFSLPKNSDHNARTLVITNNKLYVSIGSTCNVCHESSPLSATVQVANLDGSDLHSFATGLRNAAFLAVNPTNSQIWSTEMGRDNLGDELPPDEVDILIQGDNYGWPYCYGDKIHDNSFDPKRTHTCITTTSPLYQIPAHSAPLGLAFVSSKQFPANWHGDLLVAYHGSWNRSTPIGYKVVHLKVKDSQIVGSDDFLTGFLPDGALNGPNSALGRPVDLTFSSSGALFISDDKAGNIYIITKS